MTESSGPASHVLRAFGITGDKVRRLQGGQAQSFRAGDLVLKRTDNIEEARWSADVLLGLAATSAFRVAPPVRARNGDWVHKRWCAFTRIDGEHVPENRWHDVLAACRAFHCALADVSRPNFLDSRQNPWSIGDRVAWDRLMVSLPLVVAHRVKQLLELLEHLPLASQVIHGDFGGNLLFAGDQPPAVIDFSPYWRPAPFAEAIVIADAIAWNGASGDLVDWFENREMATQLLLRACIYRLATIGVASPSDDVRTRREVQAYDRVIHAAWRTA
jgi:uncharacterized protein (TIGR02569 family)